MKGKYFTLVSILIFGLSSPVFAGDITLMGERVENGLTKILTSPVQFWSHPKEELNYYDNKWLGLGKGVVESPVHFSEQLADGVVEATTFVIVDSDEYSLGKEPKEKLQDGLVYLIESPKEFIDHPKDMAEQHSSKKLGLLRGIVQSPMAFTDKFGHGLIDVLSSSVETKG